MQIDTDEDSPLHSSPISPETHLRIHCMAWALQHFADNTAIDIILDAARKMEAFISATVPPKVH